MKIRILFLLSACIIALTSCSEKKSSENSVTEAETTSSVTSVTSAEASSETSSAETTESSFMEKYKFYPEVISANKIYEYSKIEIPEKINNLDADIIDIFDEKSVFVYLSNPLPPKNYVEVGLYNFESKTYTFLADESKFPLNLAAFNENYIIFKSIDDNNKYANLYCLDLKTKKLKKFFDFSVDSKTGKVYGPDYNDILLIDNKVYFDNYSYYVDNKNLKSEMYCYDILKDKKEMIKENAQYPFSINDEVVSFVKNEKGEYKKLESVLKKGKNFSLNITDDTFSLISSGSKLFCVDKTMFSATTTGFQIKDLTGNKPILEYTNGISDLSANNYFLTWCDYAGSENLPCMYDLRSEKVVQFQDLPDKLYCFFIKDNYGIVATKNIDHTNNQYWLFKAKK